jgi:hypothetical protein
MEGALAWICTIATVCLLTTDQDTLDTFHKSKSIPMALRSPEQRAQDLGDAMNWLRDNKGKDDDANDATGEFRKLDSMLSAQEAWPIA